ncbi:MAG TPA: HDIG domain-containing protein [Solirubrobacteraceae bacterium]|jgi:putative nucleotidyltransferase with HDIG domain|nr:HDIG domain-containing protein [Solirubrobacteraceae bacterium]
MSTVADPEAALALARSALADQPAWLVGGSLRDRMLGRATEDFDILLDGDVAAAAQRVGREAGAAAFELSEAHGAWRVVGPGRSWQIDLVPLRGGSLDADLALRDFTVNAVVEPLSGGDHVDPVGGLADLERRLLRMVSSDSFDADPLRVLRLARLACELNFEIEPATAASARRAAPALVRVAAERVFTELKRLIAAPAAPRGIELLDELSITPVVLPELDALKGVEQNRFHHLDVHDHTLAVLAAVIELERDPEPLVGAEHAEAVARLLREPLADDLDRGAALRWGALLHDIAKPVTRGMTPEGRVIFPGHDVEGAGTASRVLARLRASERLQTHVAALARHHLRLGFLVHHQPLSRRAIYAYLDACDPVVVDVTLLSLADRVATRGDNAEAAIAKHVELGRSVLGEALRWRAQGRPAPLLRGDALARQLDIAPGPEVGRLLDQLAEAQFAGEVETPAEALALARTLVEDSTAPPAGSGAPPAGSGAPPAGSGAPAGS